MGSYVNQVKIGTTTHLIEPTLYAAGAGTASAITAAVNTNFALIAGVQVAVRMSVDNAVNATLNISSTGAKNIRYDSSNIAAGVLKSGRVYNFIYDGTYWQVAGELLTKINTQSLIRPSNLNGVGDVTYQALINDVRANRLAFLPADQIIIEKTIDGGNTWTDAGVSDSTKTALFSEVRPGVYLPQINGEQNISCGLRITITGMKYNVPANTPETEKYNYWNSTYVKSTERYNQIKNLYFWISSSNNAMKVKVQRATGGNSNQWYTVFENDNYAMTGWSGNDIITVSQSVFGGGTTQTGNYWNWRIILMTSGPGGSNTLNTGALNQSQSVMEIRGYGDTWWTAGNKYAASDHLYSWDYNKNATFPANLTAVKFIGPLQGTADKATAANITTTQYGVAYYSNTTGTFAGTGAGTSGQYLKSNGTSAPTWASFPSTWTPSSHTHGNITNDGKIGSTADYAVYTTTGGAITAGSLETAAPSASGNATAFITSISQNSKGKITATKANLDTSGTWSGNATTATALTSNAGGGEQPIYFSEGKPIATTYSLAASISSGTANFLTKYTGARAIGNSSIYNVPDLSYRTLTPDYTSGGEQFYKAWLVYVSKNYANAQLHIGLIGPNSQGPILGNIYDVNDRDSTTELPRYSTFLFHNLNGSLESFGTHNYNYYHRTYLTDSNASTILGLGTMASETATNYLKWQTTSSASTALYNFGVYVAQNTAAGTGPNGSNYYNLINIPYRKASGNTKLDWGWQLGNTTSNDNRLYYRTTGDNTAGDWQTIAHATTSSNNIGSATQPIYMTSTGVITAGTELGASAYHADSYFALASHGNHVPATQTANNLTFLRNDNSWYKLTKNEVNALINLLDTGSSDLTSNDYVITQYVGGGTTTTTYHRRPASKVVNATLVKAALGTVNTTAKKFLKDTGTWAQVAWDDLSGIPSTETLRDTLFPVTTYTKTVILTTEWQDVGITGTDLNLDGTYIIQLYLSSTGADSLSSYYERYSGIMSWYKDMTNSGNADEILLHRGGHAPNNNCIYLRVQRSSATATPNTLRIQIKASKNTTVEATLKFKFRWMLD